TRSAAFTTLAAETTTITTPPFTTLATEATAAFATFTTEATTTATTFGMRLCIADQLHVHRLVQDASARKVLQYFTRHTFRQFDGGVRSEQLDVTNVTAADIAFVSDRANDMTNFNTIITAH